MADGDGAAPPKKMGRPRGPAKDRINLNILTDLSTRLEQEAEAQGRSQTSIVEEALDTYFAALDARRSRGQGKQ